jgi:hypothetical protein
MSIKFIECRKLVHTQESKQTSYPSLAIESRLGYFREILDETMIVAS